MAFKNVCLSPNNCYLRLKKDKTTDYALSWKLKRVSTFKVKAHYTAFFIA